MHDRPAPLTLRRARAYSSLRGAPGALWLIGVLIATFSGVTIGTFLPSGSSATDRDAAAQAAAAAPSDDLEISLRQIAADEDAFDSAATPNPPESPSAAAVYDPAAAAAPDMDDVPFPDAPEIDLPPAGPNGAGRDGVSTIRIVPAGSPAGAAPIGGPERCTERPSAAGRTTICIRPRD